jgi:hypothetical protein
VTRVARPLFAATVVLSTLVAGAVAGDTPRRPLPERAVAITAHALPDFRIGRPADRDFGALRFVGGFEIEADTRAVSGLSGLLVREDGAAVTAITDRGVALSARVDRDSDGRPTGLSSARIRGLEATDPSAFTGFAEADSEGFAHTGAAAGDRLWISFETVPRIMTGTLGADGLPGPLTPIDLAGPVRRLRHTKGLEALAYGPPGDGPLGDRLVAIAERPQRGVDTGERPGWVLSTDGTEVAAFRLSDSGFDITDATVGPDGRLWVLERLFTLADGVSTRVRRIDPADIVDGAVVEGEEVLRADLAHQIDNMEGMDVWTAPDGRTMLSLISDDNGSFLQRSLYLEFEVVR